MKETRFFYAPDAATTNELPDSEAMHALRVVRLKSGDEMTLIDGKGNFYKAEVTLAATKLCKYKILETIPQERPWKGHLHLAIAPTKMMDRMEWMVEKAVEMGIDEISFLNCKFSERRVIKTGRLEKIIISAMKQSHKAWRPRLNEMETFQKFIQKDRTGSKFIAHCYNEIEKDYLFSRLQSCAQDEDITVLIGPEGDFAIDEVDDAIKMGYESIHLGKSRLRTETAGLAATMMMQISKEERNQY